MGAIIRTDDYGLVFTLPVEYAYADFGKLWYAEYNSTASASGASVTVFIETGAAYAQGSIYVNCTSEATVRLFELPASGATSTIPKGAATDITVYNLNRDVAATNNITDVRAGVNGIWQREGSATLLQTTVGNGYYPVDSIRSRAYWKLESSATYAITVNSKAAGNYISVSYTWNETAA